MRRRCGGCHYLDEDKEGPRLRHIYGAKAGNVASFKYSSALKSSHVVWDEATLDKWLTDLAAELQRVEMDRPVVDQTGLSGERATFALG